jgi:hypothetical protein
MPVWGGAARLRNDPEWMPPGSRAARYGCLG